MMKTQRWPWIDILRGVAIFAVVIDHGLFIFDYYHTNITYLVWVHLFFTIPWFIYLSGVSNTLSPNRSSYQSLTSWGRFLLRRFSLLIPFAIASGIAYLSLYWPRFQIKDFILTGLFFRAQPTYYFINLILQLYLIFPILYLILKTKNLFTKILFFTLITLVFSFGIPYFFPTVPWPFSPAGSILGGMYLIVFLLGMISTRISLKKSFRTLGVVVLCAIFIYAESEMIRTRGSIVGLIPTIPGLLWSVSLIGLLQFILQKVTIPQKISQPLSFLGRQSTIIYLYHFLIIWYARSLFGTSLWVFLGSIGVSVLFPILILLVRKTHSYF